jgi:threonine/homoserine/homoserine lactone efflux protein
MLGYFILGVAYAFAAVVQPGPYQTYVISQTLSNGWRRTLPAAFAPLVSDGPIAILVLVVLSQVPRWFTFVLELAGGLFLLYLAVRALNAWRRYDGEKKVQSQSIRQSLTKAVMVNLLNPNPYLGWSLVIGPLLLKGWRETPQNGVSLLVGFYGTMVAAMIGTIMLFGGARTLGPKVNRILIGISAIALAFFAFYELWLGTRTLGAQ